MRTERGRRRGEMELSGGLPSTSSLTTSSRSRLNTTLKSKKVSTWHTLYIVGAC